MEPVVVGPRIIVALDFADADQALHLASRLDPRRCRVKVGKELFVSAGPDLVRRLHDQGFEVFLDLKFHDIPNTVAGACRAAAALGVWMVNVHALGGSVMMTAAREAVDAYAKRPLLLAVTVLTSHDEATLGEIGLGGDTAGAAVERLASLAQRSGLDGVVCSAQEAHLLRKAHGESFRLLSPGIRPAGAASDDQHRVMTPARALAAGVDYLVIGRPITQAPDPVAALAAIEEEIAAAQR